MPNKELDLTVARMANPARARRSIPVFGRHEVSVTALNEIAQAAWDALIAAHPEWESHFGARGKGDLEAAIPAPSGSSAGHLVVSSNNGEDLWVRFSPPAMCYGVDSTDEMLSVIDQLLSERVDFVTTWRGSEWTGTTLVSRGSEPVVEPGEVGVVVSWTGTYDRLIPEGAEWPQWKRRGCRTRGCT